VIPQPRRKPMRLRGHNYAQGGSYFVTICVLDRQCLFGDVIEGVMLLNDLGQVVETVWKELPNRYFGLSVDQFVIMPNHVHGILTLAEVSSTVSEIVRAFKSLSAKRVNLRRHTPGDMLWQRGFHDHVVRDDADLARIREYIDTNPARWSLDEENPVRVSPATS
jgi:putative transposase